MNDDSQLVARLELVDGRYVCSFSFVSFAPDDCACELCRHHRRELRKETIAGLAAEGRWSRRGKNSKRRGT